MQINMLTSHSFLNLFVKLHCDFHAIFTQAKYKHGPVTSTLTELFESKEIVLTD